jgi:MFS family permease
MSAADTTGVQDIMRALKVPSFARLAGTYALNEIADWFASIALAILVYDHTDSALATTALFVASRFLPAFVVPALSARLDALPTARTLVGIYLVEGLTLTGLALSSSTFLLPVVLLFAFVDGALAATARALTRSATVVLMEPKGLLREGNATMNLSFTAMNAVAPIAAGALVAATNAGVVLGIAAGLFALQAISIAGARDLAAGDPEAAAWRESLGEAVAYVRAHRFLKVLLFSQVFVIIGLMMIPPIEIIYATESLDAGEVGYGVLIAAWGVGMVLGGLVFARERKRSILGLIVVGTVMQAVAYLLMAGAPTLVLACIPAVVGGIGNGMHWVSVVTAVQEATEERFQTRINALMESLVTAAPGLGFLLGGAVTSLFDPRIALITAGVIVLLSLAGWVLAGGLRGERAPAPSLLPDAEPVPEPV